MRSAFSKTKLHTIHVCFRSSAFGLKALVLGAMVGLSGTACESGGVGDPCTPEDEFFAGFNGFALEEVNVESRSFQCETRVCLVNKFQGRVSCPYGTNGPAELNASEVTHNEACEVPGFGGQVRVPVNPQRTERPPEVSVYCSCRCDGADPNARYCECPSGFECAEVVTDQGQQSDGEPQNQLAGSYCIRSGSDVNPIEVSPSVCKLPAEGQPALPDELTCGSPPSAS